MSKIVVLRGHFDAVVIYYSVANPFDEMSAYVEINCFVFILDITKVSLSVSDLKKSVGKMMQCWNIRLFVTCPIRASSYDFCLPKIILACPNFLFLLYAKKN